jgi:hypothetical protein
MKRPSGSAIEITLILNLILILSAPPTPTPFSTPPLATPSPIFLLRHNISYHPQKLTFASNNPTPPTFDLPPIKYPKPSVKVGKTVAWKV